MASFSSPASSRARRNDCASSIVALRSGVTGPSDNPTPTTHTCRCTAADATGNGPLADGLVLAPQHEQEQRAEGDREGADQRQAAARASRARQRRGGGRNTG